MQLTALLASLALATTSMTAPVKNKKTKSIYLKNKCTFPIYTWTVASTTSPTTTLEPDSSYSQPQFEDPNTGVAIKIATTPDALETEAPVFHLSYTLDQEEGRLFYDISTAFGTDEKFDGERFELRGELGRNVTGIDWEGGPPTGTEVYNGKTDLWLTVCA